jgi:hypothetical protein
MMTHHELAGAKKVERLEARITLGQAREGPEGRYAA